MINKEIEYCFTFLDLASPAKSFTKGYKIYKFPKRITIHKGIEKEVVEYNYSGFPIYNSIAKLKKKDKNFRKLPKKVKDKIEIEEMMGLILHKKEPNNNIIEFIQHSIFGDVYNKKVLGLHHILGVCNNNVIINKITKEEDKYGVYEVELKKRDNRSKYDNSIKEWRIKTSTFFPDRWDYSQLIEECFYALSEKNILKENPLNILWESKTISGVPVKIYTDKNYKLQSIFPIYTEKDKIKIDE